MKTFTYTLNQQKPEPYLQSFLQIVLQSIPVHNKVSKNRKKYGNFSKCKIKMKHNFLPSVSVRVSRRFTDVFMQRLQSYIMSQYIVSFLYSKQREKKMDKSTFLNTVPVHGTGILQNLISHSLDQINLTLNFSFSFIKPP